MAVPPTQNPRAVGGPWPPRWEGWNHPWGTVLPALPAVLVLGRGCTWSQVTRHIGGAGHMFPIHCGNPWGAPGWG